MTAFAQLTLADQVGPHLRHDEFMDGISGGLRNDHRNARSIESHRRNGVREQILQVTERLGTALKAANDDPALLVSPRSIAGDDIDFEAGIKSPLFRESFFFAPSVAVYEAPPVAFLSRAGFGLRFP